MVQEFSLKKDRRRQSKNGIKHGAMIKNIADRIMELHNKLK